jgi:hypothetical protein
MAININRSTNDEYRYLMDRMRGANSQAEYDHFARLVREMERNIGMHHYSSNFTPDPWANAPMPTVKPTPAPEVTPLSFLTKANKNLLLTGV